MNKLLSITFFTFLFSFSGLAQKGNVAAGGSGSGSGGSVEYSIGQIDYVTVSTAGTGTITQGLQQPYEIQIMTGIEFKDISLSVVAFPNPARDFVQLHISNTDFEKYHFILTDVNGKIISENKIADEKTTIPLMDLAEGIYLIKVSNEQQLKIFKIIKTP